MNFNQEMVNVFSNSRHFLIECVNFLWSRSQGSQGTILGPDLWNATYASLLKLDMPEESRLVGYADDVAALVAGRTVEQAQSRLGILMRRVSGWMTTHGFNLALEKTEVVILTKKRIPTLRPISFGESIIESKSAVKYLGLTLDSKMSFSEQIQAAANKAAAGVSALSGLMANIGGPTFPDELNAVCPALRCRGMGWRS